MKRHARLLLLGVVLLGSTAVWAQAPGNVGSPGAPASGAPDSNAVNDPSHGTPSVTKLAPQNLVTVNPLAPFAVALLTLGYQMPLPMEYEHLVFPRVSLVGLLLPRRVARGYVRSNVTDEMFLETWMGVGARVYLFPGEMSGVWMGPEILFARILAGVRGVYGIEPGFALGGGAGVNFFPFEHFSISLGVQAYLGPSFIPMPRIGLAYAF